MSDIFIDFDPSIELPIGLKNVRVVENVDPAQEEADADFDFQNSVLHDFDEIGDSAPEGPENGVKPPFSIFLMSQTVRTVSGGGSVVDLELAVSTVEGAVSYDIRQAIL